MTEPSPSLGLDPPDDALYALIHEYSERIARGEELAVEDFVSAHPHYSEFLRSLLPALSVLRDLSQSADSMMPPDESDRPGQVPQALGDFRIIRQIGRGGMGVVYEA